jgi:hypothetical protein
MYKKEITRYNLGLYLGRAEGNHDDIWALTSIVPEVLQVNKDARPLPGREWEKPWRNLSPDVQNRIRSATRPTKTLHWRCPCASTNQVCCTFSAKLCRTNRNTWQVITEGHRARLRHIHKVPPRSRTSEFHFTTHSTFTCVLHGAVYSLLWFLLHDVQHIKLHQLRIILHTVLYVLMRCVHSLMLILQGQKHVGVFTFKVLN